MIKLILNITLMVILALCIWGGFKRGLIGGIAGFLAVLIALVAANALTTRYGKEVVPALSPFVGGFIDSETNTDEILANWKIFLSRTSLLGMTMPMSVSVPLAFTVPFRKIWLEKRFPIPIGLG